jgi:HSP20 family protein
MEEPNMLVRFEREIDSLFQNFLATPWTAGAVQRPAIDVAEYESETVVVAELPGVKKDDVKLTVHDGLLTIAGQRKSGGLPENSRWLRNETTAGSFARTIEMPHAVNGEAISAELTNGILKIVLPKADEARAREIRVK